MDSFTDRPFAGNPAAVVLLTEPRDDAWMQHVAAEMKHAETAFVTQDNHLRWFTPEVEVDLCGHATLATAHVLGGEQAFTTRSGVLTCANDDGWVRMDFPADPPELTDPPIGLEEALPHATIKSVSRGRFDYLIELGSAAEVRSLRPDVQGLAQISSRGVIVTAMRRRRSGHRQPVLLSGRRHPGGPRHRIGPLHPCVLLGAPAQAG